MLPLEKSRRQILIWTVASMIIVIVGWLLVLKWELKADKKNSIWQEISIPIKENNLEQDFQTIKDKFNSNKKRVIKDLSSTLENISSTTSTITTTTATTTTK